MMPYSIPRAMPLIALPLLLVAAGCENVAPRQETLERIEVELEQGSAANAAAPVPAAVADALIPTLSLESQRVPIIEDQQRFDISVNGVPADQFFMSLVDGTSYNMVVHPEVAGEISLNLRNVTIPDVLSASRDVYGYEFTSTDYGFQVLPSRLEARVYQINYLNIERNGASSTFVSAGTLQEGPGAPQFDGGGDGSGMDGGRGQRAVVGTQINTVLPETSFWGELVASLNAIVGDGSGRSVVVNPQSGVVVVRALPPELREVEMYLRATQLIAQRQVILEAKILEVRLAEGFQSGINWAAMAGDFSGLQTGGGTNLVNETGTSDIAGAPVNLAGNGLDVVQPLASAFGGVFGLAVNAADFSAFIELLETQGNVQVLSSPRISTMNNQKALIKVGTDEFFVTDVSTTTITGTATTSTPNIELTPFFSGIALDVTPQISGAGDIMLHIHPTVSTVVDQQKNISISGINQTLPLARSTVRESDSIVRASNGQLVVIGGLMQDRTEDLDAKTPGLGDLPLIGGMFRSKRAEQVKSELVILLKPIVIDSPQRWADSLDSTGTGIKRLRDELDSWKERRTHGVGYGRKAP
ncbi:MAG: pilus (MSHA type) biogenesis protein MshL [Gammaproteobacteria bacterium]|nr:pilus (MSHA type) biogenesis protein MshL [Gammaproteobacteria bacterium]